MKESMRKRVLAVIMAILMVVGMIPVMGSTEAKAEDTVKATHTFDPSTVTPGDIIEDTAYADDNFFTMCGNADKKLTIQSSGATIDGVKYSIRCKTNGASAVVDGKAKRAISFTTTGKVKLTVTAISGSNGQTRHWAVSEIVNGSYADTAENTFSVDNTKTAEACIHSIVLDKAGTYYIHATDSSVAFYKIVVEEYESSGSTPDPTPVDPPAPTVVKNGLIEENGQWQYYVKDEKQTTTGLVQSGGAYWYAKNGILDQTYTGEVDGYYVKNGKNDRKLTGLGLVDGQWKYFKNGKFDTSYTGLVENGGAYWYVTNGVLDQSKTGNVDGYYVKNGKNDRNYTGVGQPSGTGDWKYVKNGKFDDSYTGLVSNAGCEWYIKNGLLDTSFSGTYGGKTVSHGKVVN